MVVVARTPLRQEEQGRLGGERPIGPGKNLATMMLLRFKKPFGNETRNSLLLHYLSLKGNGHGVTYGPTGVGISHFCVGAKLVTPCHALTAARQIMTHGSKR